MLLYPTKHFAATATSHDLHNNNNITIVALNTTSTVAQNKHHANASIISPALAVADMGATSFSSTKGAPSSNKRIATNLISVTLPDGCTIMSTHVWDVKNPGLPTVLTGHILPDMTTASLFGIRILCKAGCTVVFDNDKCQVIFNKKVILTGYKDPISDLWTLPILPNDKLRTTHDAQHHQLPGPCIDSTPQPTLHEMNFSHHRTTKENNVKSMHQCLCNPPKSSLLAAICQGFLRRAPHLTTKAVSKYLPPSPATSKGHMKRRHKGLSSTTPKVPRLATPTLYRMRPCPISTLKMKTKTTPMTDPSLTSSMTLTTIP
jgi:hypothetical protein